MARPGEQAIKCNVGNCRFHDDARACTLSDIVVGQDPLSGEARQKADTICSNFQAK